MNTNGFLQQRSIPKEAPSCVQNAMMTKDKKPFTYTPGGIDLSQIKSERMAKRLARNAQSEGTPMKSYQEKRPNQPENLYSPNMGAAAMGVPFRVLPSTPEQQPTVLSKQEYGFTPPPPPPPTGMTLAPPNSVNNSTRKSPSPQNFEPPPMGLRPEIKIPPNPMANLRKVAPPVEKNTFWKDEYIKERSKSPLVDAVQNSPVSGKIDDNANINDVKNAVSDTTDGNGIRNENSNGFKEISRQTSQSNPNTYQPQQMNNVRQYETSTSNPQPVVQHQTHISEKEQPSPTVLFQPLQEVPWRTQRYQKPDVQQRMGEENNPPKFVPKIESSFRNNVINNEGYPKQETSPSYVSKFNPVMEKNQPSIQFPSAQKQMQPMQMHSPKHEENKFFEPVNCKVFQPQRREQPDSTRPLHGISHQGGWPGVNNMAPACSLQQQQPGRVTQPSAIQHSERPPPTFQTYTTQTFSQAQPQFRDKFVPTQNYGPRSSNILQINLQSKAPVERIVPIRLEETSTDVLPQASSGTDTRGCVKRYPNQFVDQGYNNYKYDPSGTQQQYMHSSMPYTNFGNGVNNNPSSPNCLFNVKTSVPTTSFRAYPKFNDSNVEEFNRLRIGKSQGPGPSDI